MNEEKFLTSVYYFFKTIGLSTASFNQKWLEGAKDSRRTLLFQRSKLGIAYNVFLLCVLSVTNSYLIYFFYRTPYQKGVMFENVMDTIQTVLSYCVSVIVVLTYCCRQSSVVSLASTANRIRDLMTGHSIKRDTLIRSIGKLLLLSLVSWSLVIVITAIAYSYEVIVCRMTSYYICSLIINAVFLQYIIVLKIIRLLLAQVNNQLIEISRQQTNVWTTALVHCPKIQSCIRTTNKVDQLMQLQRLHSLLSKASRDVSDFYAMPMFLCTFYVFFTTIHVFYYVGKPLVLQEIGLDWDEYCFCAVYTFNYLSSLSTLTSSVTAVLMENKKSGDIISNFMLNTESKHILEQLTTFSLHLLHTEPKFSVYGLYSLDESLMISVSIAREFYTCLVFFEYFFTYLTATFKIVGSITTYLVIVLQFQEKRLES